MPKDKIVLAFSGGLDTLKFSIAFWRIIPVQSLENKALGARPQVQYEGGILCYNQ